MPETPNANINQQDLEHLKELISDFCMREYNEALDDSAFADLTCIGIAETTADDREDISISVTVNVPAMTVEMFINGDRTDSVQYDSLREMATDIRHSSFDEMVLPGPLAEKRIERIKKQFPMEQDFLNNPDDCFALYQIKPGPDYRQLQFTEMDILNVNAERFRERIHKELEQIEDTVFDSKAAIEQYLQNNGFTIVPGDNPDRITVRDDFWLEADFCLQCGDQWCKTDSCDTRKLEQKVQHRNYDLIYTAVIPDECAKATDVNAILETLYFNFNVYRPEDFDGHSMSVGDVIVLKQNGKVTSYFTDSIGFEKIPDFIDLNPLRNAEMAIEDDCNMIDGIINNGEKPSVLNTLKECQGANNKNHPTHTDTKARNDAER